MTVKLDKPIRREIVINGETHTVVISSAGVIITKKRARAGVEYGWKSLAAGAPAPSIASGTRMSDGSLRGAGE